MAYEVNTPVFDGPFDLLLHLILQEEVDIHEVSLLRIVEAYLVEVQKMQTFDLEIATEFLLIAATLVELKTRRLLPGKADMDLDEELALWEERDLLLARLLDCKTFKDVASVFSDLVEKAGLSFARMAGPDERFAELMPDLLEGVNPVRLQRAFMHGAEGGGVHRYAGRAEVVVAHRLHAHDGEQTCSLCLNNSRWPRDCVVLASNCKYNVGQVIDQFAVNSVLAHNVRSSTKGISQLGNICLGTDQQGST